MGAIITLFGLAAIIAAYVFAERRIIRNEFYSDPTGKRCFVSIESGSTTVVLKGTVKEQSEYVSDMYFVRTDKGFLYVSEISEMKPVYFEWPTELIKY